MKDLDSRIRKLFVLALDPRTGEKEAEAAWGRLFRICRGDKLTMEQLSGIFNQLPERSRFIMPFGQFAGQPIEEVLKTSNGRAYLATVLGKPFGIDRDLAGSIIDLVTKMQKQ